MDYKVIVIGGGPGGYGAAIRLAQLGASVCLVERNRPGGTCLNRGCIPTKALVSTAGRVREIKDAANFGLHIAGWTVDYQRAVEKKKEVVDQLVKGLYFLFKKHKIDLVEGVGKITGPGRVKVELNGGESQELQAENIIIATGSEPAMISSLGYDGMKVVTSTEALEWPEIPESLLIVGGGVIGCEFAGIFNSLGTQVKIIEAAPTILPMIDQELARRLQLFLKQDGMEIRTGFTVKSVDTSGEEVKATLENGEVLSGSKLLISVGRVLNTQGLGLEEIGIITGKRGEIAVDGFCRTSVPGVYAVGDITGVYQLAHVAHLQGLTAAAHIMGQGKPADYQAIPSCIFTFPEAAGVGITSQEAEAKGIKTKVGKFSFGSNGRALSAGETKGMVKVLADAETDMIVGIHMMGPHVTELIAGATLAIRRGLTVLEYTKTVFAHPTLSEALLEAAEAVYGLAIHA